MLKWGLVNGQEGVKRGSSGPHIPMPHFSGISSSLGKNLMVDFHFQLWLTLVSTCSTPFNF